MQQEAKQRAIRRQVWGFYDDADNAAIFARLQKSHQLPREDIEQLADLATLAWARAPHDVYTVGFAYQNEEYKSTMGFFFVRILTMTGTKLFSFLKPDDWPHLPHLHRQLGKRQSRQALPRALRFAIFKRDNYRCQLCGRARHDAPQVCLEVDHRIAVAQGGTNGEENLWTLCRDCNRGKSDQAL